MKKRSNGFFTMLCLMVIAVVCFYNAHVIIADAREGDSQAGRMWERSSPPEAPEAPEAPTAPPAPEAPARRGAETLVDESSNINGNYITKQANDVITMLFDKDINEFNISLTSRDLYIEPWDGDKIEVSYTESGYDEDNLNISQSGNVLNITQKSNIGWSGFNGFTINLDFFSGGGMFGFGDSSYMVTIKVPHDCLKQIEAATVSGDMTVTVGKSAKSAFEAEFKSTSGDINIESITADELECKTVSGEIFASDINAKEADINSTSGDININGKIGELEFSTISGYVELSGDMPKIEGKTTSGDFNLEADKNINMISFTTISGYVSLDIPNRNPSTWFKSVSGDIDGNVTLSSDKGSAMIRVQTTSGDLTITSR